MSFYDGLIFFIVLFLGCIPAVILGMTEKRIGNYTILFSVGIIFIIYRNSSLELFYLLLYLFLEWHLIVLHQYSMHRYGRNKTIFYHALIFALLPLAAAKLSGFIGHHWFSFLGISYITFKVLQIIIESYDGIIEKSSFCPTLSFLIFFPTLSSGPIDRSRRFEQEFDRRWERQKYAELLQKGIWKILVGVLYKFVLSAIAYDILGRISGRYDLQFIILYAYVYGMMLGSKHRVFYV